MYITIHDKGFTFLILLSENLILVAEGVNEESGAYYPELMLSCLPQAAVVTLVMVKLKNLR